MTASTNRSDVAVPAGGHPGIQKGNPEGSNVHADNNIGGAIFGPAVDAGRFTGTAPLAANPARGVAQSRTAYLIALLTAHPSLTTETLCRLTGLGSHAVRAYRSQIRRGLKIRSGASPSRPRGPQGTELPSYQRWHERYRTVQLYGNVRTCAVEREALAALEMPAAARGITVPRLIRMLLLAITDEGMVDAILDDGVRSDFVVDTRNRSGTRGMESSDTSDRPQSTVE